MSPAGPCHLAPCAGATLAGGHVRQDPGRGAPAPAGQRAQGSQQPLHALVRPLLAHSFMLQLLRGEMLAPAPAGQRAASGQQPLHALVRPCARILSSASGLAWRNAGPQPQQARVLQVTSNCLTLSRGSLAQLVVIAVHVGMGQLPSCPFCGSCRSHARPAAAVH